MDIPDFNTDTYSYMPDQFYGIPRLERQPRRTPYFDLPNRATGAYNSYHSYGNIAARYNRANDVSHVEDLYYGSEAIPQPPRRGPPVVLPATPSTAIADRGHRGCTCSQSAELKGELRTMKKMHDMIMFLLVCLVVYLLFFNNKKVETTWIPPSSVEPPVQRSASSKEPGA